jgi:ABC-2 type transport system permease protein
VKHIVAIARRELYSMFSTPLGWVLLGLHLVFTGYLFFAALQEFMSAVERVQASQQLQFLNMLNLNTHVIGIAFGAYEIVLILLLPLLTMRVFAEERANGTIELLLTSPVTSTELVLGKYLSILAVIGLMVLLTSLYPGLLFVYGNPEVLQTLAGLLGLFLLSAALGALGCFTSTLTRSPTIAAVTALIVGLMLFLAGLLADQVPAAWASAVVRFLALGPHFDGMLEGLIRSEDLAYFAGFIAFFLTLARTGVESMRVR